MRTILFFILMIVLITGCSFQSVPINGKEIEITNEQRIYTKSGSVSATAPNNFPKIPFMGYTRFDHDLINFDRHLSNMMSEDVRVTVSVIPKNEIADDYLLYKNQGNQMEERRKNFKMSDWEKKNNAERGVNYVKNYVDFIGGLKCGTRVESSNIAMGVGTKSYQTNCTYFDNRAGAKNIHFDYRYTYTHSGTKYDSDTKSSSISPEMMQIQFKQDMKAIFDSLVIHDMDRDKMSKEGLLHDKKYNVDTENNTKNMYE